MNVPTLIGRDDEALVFSDGSRLTLPDGVMLSRRKDGLLVIRADAITITPRAPADWDCAVAALQMIAEHRERRAA